MFLCKNQRNIEKKCDKNLHKTAISGIFPLFSAGKNFFSKIGFGHVLGIANTRLCAKNQKKTNDEISKKCQKTGFSGIFPAFSAGNEFFPEIGLRHIFGIAILHLCAKNHKKLMSQSREKLVTVGRTDANILQIIRPKQ